MRRNQRVEGVLGSMTQAEKIGQLWQVSHAQPAHKDLVREGKVGSVLNVTGQDAAEFQRIAVEESRLGIPLLIGRDVIHGFRTVFPIPLGQASSWNPDLARRSAEVAAREAAAVGVNWTFAPMVDIARDPRWGRVAESCGEDPYLAGEFGAAMTEGFQGGGGENSASGGRRGRRAARRRLNRPGCIAACAKHYIGYGAAEGGRDYNTTLIPERTLRNLYLPPFRRCIDAGAVTVMSAFNELNDIPASGNEFTIRKLLKKELAFDGLVVSDWGAVSEMIHHGYCADHREAALAALRAGVDMEMVSTAYRDHLAGLLEAGEIRMEWIDDAVRRILGVKFALGLFDRAVRTAVPASVILSADHLEAARESARESCVLLKNDGILPWLGTGRLAVIGPLADAAADQLGCWALDGEVDAVRTVVDGFREALGADRVLHAAGLSHARGGGRDLFPDAVDAARRADVAVLVLGEDVGLSGEAHCRTSLNLPGAQDALLDAVCQAGKPVVAVVLAGRPLTVGGMVPRVHALLWAWHPGTMGGPAIADLLLGRAEPCGRLPVTFPRSVGQIPLYYNHKNTGRPPIPTQQGGPLGTVLDPNDFTSRYLDEDFRPLFVFGYGLGYTTFAFGPVKAPAFACADEGLRVSATVTNTGARRGVAVAQLYLRFPHGPAVRPVRELRAFRRLTLEPGEAAAVDFDLGFDDLAAWSADMTWRVEPRPVDIWIAPDAACAGCEPARVELRPKDGRSAP